MKTIKCQHCGKEVECQSFRKKWCSTLCTVRAQQKRISKKCADCDKIIAGKSTHCKKCAAKYINHHWGEKISKAVKGLSKNSSTKFKKGVDHPNWKGGGIIQSERHRFMALQPYKNWRTEVFNKDNYTCQHCGERGGVLHADHIKSYNLFPEHRLDIENGRTLCVKCHRKTPTWGTGKAQKTGTIK